MPSRKTRIRPRNSAKQSGEFKRVYHSKQRQTFVAWLPCVGCRSVPCHGHHIETDGMGRKAGYALVIPLCPSCHRWVHDHSRAEYEARFSVDFAAWAMETEARWQAR